MRSCRPLLRGLQLQIRFYSSPASPRTSPSAPRSLLSIANLSRSELITLIRNAGSYKGLIKWGSGRQTIQSLRGRTVAMMFNKRSTRTRISTEGAVCALGGHPMFLGKDDIQMGVNESAYDSAVVISSMVSAIVARVGPHSDITELAKNSTVPVISALSDDSHPMQTIADLLTIYEAQSSVRRRLRSWEIPPGLGLEGLKIAWVGDANNVLFDLAIGAAKLGIHVAVATPKGYEIPQHIRATIEKARKAAHSQATLETSNVPEDVVKDADFLVTDTWVSMGFEEEAARRKADFAGYQITSELAERGGAKPGWKFLHCLPRHSDEVSDEVFYNPARSLVFPEAENRLWAAMAVLDGFVVNKGAITGFNQMKTLVFRK